MCLPAHDPAMDGGAAAGEPRERTFLIADVRGYTRFTREHGDEAAARLAQAFAGLAYDSVEARGGRLVEVRGDEALAVFPSPAAAVRAAAELIAACEEERPRAQSFRSSRAWDRGRRRWRAGRPLLRTRHGGAQGLRAACRADRGRRRSRRCAGAEASRRARDQGSAPAGRRRAVRRGRCRAWLAPR